MVKLVNRWIFEEWKEAPNSLPWQIKCDCRPVSLPELDTISVNNQKLQAFPQGHDSQN
jgi:hypothetical protein